MGPRLRRMAAAAAVAAALLAARSDAELSPLTLFQRCGRSPWIIFGEVEDGDDRLAEVKVFEAIKGAYGQPRLRVVYRLENWLREGWEGKIAFRKGDQVVLFLKRYDPADTEGIRMPEKLAGDDVFASTFGAMGVFPLPAEGQEALLEAVRTFARVTGVQDPVEQEEAVLAMLASANPQIVDAALEQTLARRLALPDHIGLLMRISEEGREPSRIDALKVLLQIAEDLEAAARTLPDQADLVDRLKARVLGREPDELRTVAVQIVARMGGAGEREFLRRLAREDRSQDVRYEASRALLDLGG